MSLPVGVSTSPFPLPVCSKMKLGTQPKSEQGMRGEAPPAWRQLAWALPLLSSTVPRQALARRWVTAGHTFER